MQLLMLLLSVVGRISADEARIGNAIPSQTLNPPGSKTVSGRINRDDEFLAHSPIVGPEQALPYNFPEGNFEHFFQNGLDDPKESSTAFNDNIDHARLAGFTSSEQSQDFETPSNQQYAANGGYSYPNKLNHEEFSTNTEFNTADSDFGDNTNTGNGVINKGGFDSDNIKLGNTNGFTSTSNSNSFTPSVNEDYLSSSNGFTGLFTPNNCGGGCLSSASNSIGQEYPSFNACGSTSSISAGVNTGCGFQPSVQPNYSSYQPTRVITKEIRIPVPQPYPVTVERKVPVPVSKPYPITFIQKVPIRVPIYVMVPQRIRVEVPKPYPVEKRVPYPIQVKVPVYIRVPVPVNNAPLTNFNQYQQNYQKYPIPTPAYGAPAPVYGPPGYQSRGPLKK